MKVRNGFVSNSSSSSFIITQEPPAEIAKWFEPRVTSDFENAIAEYLNDYGRGYREDGKFIWYSEDEQKMWDSFTLEDQKKIAYLANWVDEYPEEVSTAQRKEWCCSYDDSYQNPPIGEVLAKHDIPYEYSRD